MSQRKSTWPYRRKSNGRTAKRRRAKREDLTLQAVPANMVKRNKVGSGYLIYSGPNNCPLPTQWIGKYKTKAMALIPTANFSAAGIIKFTLPMNTVFQPLDTILAALTITDGGAATRGPIGLSTLLGTDAYLTAQVLACKVKINVVPTLTSDQVMVALTPSSITAASFDMAQCLSAPFTKTRISTLYVGNSMHATNESPNTLTNYVDFARFLGIAQSTFNEDTSSQWSANHGASPATAINMILYLQTMDGAITTNPMPIEIELEQTVRLYGLDNGLLA